MVASHDPLPPFRAWKDRLRTVPWRAGLPGESGVVWRYDGTGLTPLTADDPSGTRSKGFKALGGGRPVGELANWLGKLPGVDAVAVEAFLVVAPPGP